MGAFDYVEKPLSLERIVVSVQNGSRILPVAGGKPLLAAESHPPLAAHRQEPGRGIPAGGDPESGPTNATVLITGENGTGKELVARMLHQLSRRSQRPMVEVNCAAIPEELIESELFGHEKGAFTGAHERRKGKFDSANEGTLFLDEIGDMSLRTQAKILRIIQEQNFERVGGSRPIQVDVRIVAATNKDLQQEIDAGRFRQDLYYRLNVIPIRVPPLRERLQDIPLLVEDFLRQVANESSMGRKEIDPAVYRLSAIIPLAGECKGTEELRGTPRDHDAGTDHQGAGPAQGLSTALCNHSEITNDPYQLPSFKEARASFEREYLVRKLEECSWNISLTAQQIGVERSHLHRKMKALGIREVQET